MPRVTLNLEDARSFSPAEPGPYTLTINAISAPRASKTKGTLGVDVEFRFKDPDMDQKCGGITRFYPIEGKGAGFFRELWKAATGEDLPVGSSFDIDTDDAIGREVIGQVVNEAETDESGNPKPGGRVFNRVEQVVAAQ